MKKIVICGGHLTPALALIEQLEKEKDVKVLFFGRKFATEGSKNLSAEYRAIKSKNIPFYNIPAGRLQRKFTQYTIPSLSKVPLGFIKSFFLLIVHRPHFIVSFGSYLSIPVVISGWFLNIKSITHEQSSVPGLSTKINSLFSQKVFLSWPESEVYLKSKKSEVIGNLIRPSVFKKSAKDHQISTFLKKSKNLIFVTGGNQGSHFLNNLIFNSRLLLKNFEIIHQVGHTNFAGDLDIARKIKDENYLSVEYIKDQDIGAVLNKAKLVVSRSGANTIWELSLLAKVALLIPLSVSAGGEQMANAKILKDAKSAKILSQEKLTPEKFVREVKSLVNQYDFYFNNALEFRKKLVLKNPSKKLLSYILAAS